MTIEIKVPELPESVAEATVGEWQKQAGDRVDVDENLVDLETDKVMLEVPATAGGTIKEIRVEAGQTVHAGDVLAILEEGESGGAANQTQAAPQQAKPTNSDAAAVEPKAPENAGATVEIKVPELPESVSEATVGEWKKQAGDQVDMDENLVDLETDKVMLEVPASAKGTLKEIRADAGQTVQAGDVLAIVAEGSGDGAAEAGTEPQQAAHSDSTQAASGGTGATIASPAARKLMEENNLDTSDIQGTGKDGRITKADVNNAVAAQQSRAAAKPEPNARPEPAQREPEDVPHEKVDHAALSDAGGERVEQRVPMTRIRARIAERLLEATQNTAMLTTFNEVDMQAVFEVRERYKEQFQKSHDVRLGFMSFFVKAAVEALKRFPVVNASIDEGDVVYHGYYDIGIAVSAPRGLLVPILRDADQLSYAEVEAKIRDFGKRAQDNKIKMEELTGGTFTITNGGVFGSMLSTPLLNPPQSAILGMHAINERPVVVDGEVRVRPVMYVALSYDHRLIDGKDAVMFLRTIKELIEDPPRLLLQI